MSTAPTPGAEQKQASAFFPDLVRNTTQVGKKRAGLLLRATVGGSRRDQARITR
jgi:hypothetical protein